MQNNVQVPNKCTFYRVLFTWWKGIIITACLTLAYINPKTQSKSSKIQVEDISTISRILRKSRQINQKCGFSLPDQRFLGGQGGLLLTGVSVDKNADFLRGALSVLLSMSAFYYKSLFLAQKPSDIEPAFLIQKRG